MLISDLLFYLLGSLLIVFSLAVISCKNPIYSALNLAATMILLAFVFLLLQAPFVAGVQLIIYAGAVIVLFVMVMMLFDLKEEPESFSDGRLSIIIKVASSALVCGLISGSAYLWVDSAPLGKIIPGGEVSMKDLAIRLFSEYLLAFEALGLLLLLVAIGVVAVSRVKGGTHAG